MKTLYKIRLIALTSVTPDEIWAESEIEAITIWIREHAKHFRTNSSTTLRVERSRIVEVTNIDIPQPEYDFEVLR